MSVRWRLRGFLRAHRITPYRLMKESGLAQGTVYRLTNDATTGLSTDTLDTLLHALGRLTGKDVAITDVLEYTKEEQDGGEAGQEAR